MNQRKQFMLCRENGVSKAGKYLVLSTLCDDSLTQLKVAYITTKKVGKAHQRNAIRRKLRAITQKHGDNIAGKRYLVTIARWSATNVPFCELEKDWLKLAKRLNILSL